MTKYLKPHTDFHFDIECFSCVARRCRVSRHFPDGISVTIHAPDRPHFFTYDFNLSKNEIKQFAAKQVLVLLNECIDRVRPLMQGRE